MKLVKDKFANKIMDGKLVADEIYKSIEKNYQQAKALGKLKRPPKLVVILIGANEASLVYIKQKIKACEMLGFDCEIDQHADSKGYDLEKVREIIRKHNLRGYQAGQNGAEGLDGIILQMPLPEGIPKQWALATINPKYDVDGVHPLSYGETALDRELEYYPPCTANGVIKMLEYYKVDIEGKRIVIVGTGIVAGKGIGLMLMNRGATVTFCNSKTSNLKSITKEADILISAVGKSKFIKADMVKKDAVVVDVGISRDGEERLSGDVDFENVIKKVKLISPVPGGVGKLTVACLMENLLKAAIAPRTL